jgi:ElaB/YqjD/DUF883 family membrane-anchored ribosome-binding protein
MSTDTLERLLADFRRLAEEAEKLAEASLSATHDETADLKERLGGTLADARRRLELVEEALTARGKAAGRAADDFVNEHPWRAVGIAGAVGLVLGLLVRPRR